MSAAAISCEGISKRYQLGEMENYRALRDSLAYMLSSPWRRLRNARRGQAFEKAKEDTTLWALQDVSFRVTPGEVVGIIGRNGSGKSTLLKILSRITEPTHGNATIRGRIGSLLEVGTGFHQELTGRENIYLNSAILGMKRAEVERRFDEIVAFAEVEKFLDTPVKHYSSGMYIRLAFAVAAHLEPEILLVDEVLAVGDTRFQRKCLNKMQSVGQEGRTVLFVSHSMPAITRLCPRTILLDAGRVAADGPSHRVISHYLDSGLGALASREWSDPRQAPGNQVARLRSIRVVDEEGRLCEAADIRKPLGIEMRYEVLQPGHELVPNYHFFNEEGVYLFVSHDLTPAYRHSPRPPGIHVSTAWVPGNFFAEGTVWVGAALSTMEPVRVHFHERDVVAFHVVDTLEGDSARGDIGSNFPGVIRPLLRWTNEQQPCEMEVVSF